MRHAEPLGRHANFVINFCQILFDPKPRELHVTGGAAHESIRRPLHPRPASVWILALRLIRHEARTFTIRQWTGLSDDRIRKLYRSYVLSERCEQRRDAASRQVPAPGGILLQKSGAHVSRGAAGEPVRPVRLAVRHCLGLESRYRVGSLESGTLLCQAYEAYRELHAPASISFEHAWFLLLALARRDEIGVGPLRDCGGVRLARPAGQAPPRLRELRGGGLRSRVLRSQRASRALLEFAPCAAETCSPGRIWSGRPICARTVPGSRMRSPMRAAARCRFGTRAV